MTQSRISLSYEEVHPMKITYLHQYFNTPNMTGGTRSYEMARRLVAMGHEVNMITSWREDDGRSDWFETNEDGIRVHWLPVPYSNHMNYRERTHAFLRFAWKSAAKAAEIPADVVFATSTPLTIALPGAYAARRQNVPMVFEVRDLWPELPIAMGALRNPVTRYAARKLEHFAYRRSAHVVALSPGMQEGVVKAGVPIEKTTVIPNGADLDLFAPERQDPNVFRDSHPTLGDAPMVVYTGTLGAANGVDYLPRIAAAARSLGSKIQFVVVGRGGCEKQVRDEADRLGVLGINFHLLPPVSKKEMPNVLAAADLALSLFIDLKPLWANSANKFFDALASGTPIAINYGGWQADLLRESGAGLIIPPNDAEAAARSIMAFLQDRERVHSSARAARRLAEDRFSRDQLAEQLASVLEKSVHPSSTRR